MAKELVGKKPIKLIAEFDGERQESLLSVETQLNKRDVRDGDWLYIRIYSAGELVDTKWEWIRDLDYVEVVAGGLKLDFYDLLVEGYDYSSGTYEIEYCVKRKACWPNEWVRVAEISKNKMEFRVDAVDEDSLTTIRPPLLDGKYYAPLDIYTGNHKDVDLKKDQFFKAINWVWDEYYEDETLILKLADKIDKTIRVGNQLELWDSIISENTVTVEVIIETPKNVEPYTELRGPLVTLDVNTEVGKPTEFQTWDQLLGGSDSVNARLENVILSGSDSAELNIDYRKFENYVHFSSAKERLTNFQYKVSLIEYYDSQSLAHSSGLVGQPSSSVTGSDTYISLSADYTKNSENLKGTFDQYEKYLYYDSSSAEIVDGYQHYPTTWPKQADHTFAQPLPYSITSSNSQTWLTGSLSSASLYDINNYSLLRKTVPGAIRTDAGNTSFMLFVDMIAQHFDELYNYIDKLNSQRNRDEDLNEGISKDLLFDSLKSFGWKPQSGLDLTKVWEYWLGSNEEGLYQQTSSAEFTVDTGPATLNYVESQSLSRRDLELEPISRVINNLPYILKTKGTTRGLRALLNCYGIPKSFFKIQEFGGPDPNRNISGSHLREIEVENYALRFHGGDYDTQLNTKYSYVSSSWDTSTNTVGIRIKPDEDQPTNASMSIFMTSTGTIPAGAPKSTCWIEKSGSSKSGWVHYSTDLNGAGTYRSGSSDKLPLFDNDWWNVFVRLNGDLNTITLKVQKAPDHSSGIITHKSTTTISAITTVPPKGWDNTNLDFTYLGAGDTFTGWAGGSKKINCFSGSMQEFRLWKEELEDFVMDLHTLAPTSIVGNTYSSSYDSLLLRHSLGADISTPSTASSMTSSHTNQSSILSTDGINKQHAYFSGSLDWTDQEEVYYITTPNSLGMRAVSNKIRIEDNTVNGTLDPFQSQESSSSDTNPIDLPDLYVSISPQDDLDVNIGLQLGNVRMDDFIGDPRDKNRQYYPALKELRDLYFEKLGGPQNLQAYIRTIKYINTALFKQIDLMLPARGTNVVGLMIKPTLLERPKVSTEPDFYLEEEQYLGKTGQSQQNLEHYTQSIDCFNEDMLKQSDDYDSMVYTYDHDGTWAQQTFSTLTDTVRTEAGNEPNRYEFNIATKDAITGNIRSTNFNGSVLSMSVASVMPQAYDQPPQNVYYKTIYHYSSSYSASLHNWYSASFSPAQIVQQDVFAGLYNSFVGGCKMTSPDFNIGSSDTIDGGPVVEYTEGNPNVLISDEPSFKGDLDVR